MAKQPADITKEDIQKTATELGKKEKKYAPAELLQIFDDLLFSGEYKEEVTIKGKLKVTFRTRTAEETMEISKALDSSDYKLLTTMGEQRAFLNLSKSLVGYQGKDLSQLKPEEKTAMVKRIPTPLMGSIVDALAEFDRKVELATSEAEENF